jgi:dihydrofolate reductase
LSYPGGRLAYVPKTQYYTATTIDGYIADPDNSLEWLFAADEGREDDMGGTPFATFFAGVGAFVMGATTYEWVLDHEKLLESPAKWQRYYQDVPAWVFTHRDLPPIPGADLTFVRGDVRPVHEAMTARAGGKNLWVVGGGELAGAFADEGLLDELILGVAPATLGAGAPLLPRRLTSSRLRLTAVEQRGQFAYLTYALGAP